MREDADDPLAPKASTGPFPVLDLSAHGMLACLAAAGRSHVGDYAPADRPRAPRAPEHLRWAAAPDRLCPYCLAPEPLGGEEHALSVALGNWFWVLPPNAVCGRCNSGVLSRLDTELQNQPLIALTRTLSGITGRKGQPPSVGASNVTMRRDADGTLKIATNHERHVRRSAETVNATAQWVNVGPPQRRVTARALLKVAVGIIWLARGPYDLAQSHFDHVRDAIAGDKAVPLRYGFGDAEIPNHGMQVLVVGHSSAPGIHVSFDYFGIRLWTETAGYREQADPDFLRREIDVEFDS